MATMGRDYPNSIVAVQEAQGLVSTKALDRLANKPRHTIVSLEENCDLCFLVPKKLYESRHFKGIFQAVNFF